MAGTPKFDRTEVLLNAARQFADRGYEGTSISHLVEATGLLRGSLYGAFGSKAELFRHAFELVHLDSSRNEDMKIDLIVVALRERAAHDEAVSACARAAILSLDNSDMPASERIYARLLARAGVALPNPQDTTQQKEAHHG